ncbi:MAG: hypothetical protein ACLQLH_05895 [Terracidiphilus sp.]|jgi:hypothetical protein
MSLLRQQSPGEINDVAPGEEYTKGSSHVVIAGIIATLAVSAAIGIYVLAGQKPPMATGEIEQMWAHPQHTESSGFDANGEAMAKESLDQVFVFALVKLHNQSDQPLYLRNAMINAKLSDGIHSSYAASAADYDRVYLAYPSMPVPHGKALSLQSTIDPGQTVEGTIVSAFRMSKADWDAGKDLNVTFTFSYQPSLVLAPKTAVIEQ